MDSGRQRHFPDCRKLHTSYVDMPPSASGQSVKVSADVRRILGLRRLRLEIPLIWLALSKDPQYRSGTDSGRPRAVAIESACNACNELRLIDTLFASTLKVAFACH